MIKPIPNRRSFRTMWDEIDYLYQKAGYWLVYMGNRRRASRYVNRLRRLIGQADPHEEAILGAECRALIADYDGDLSAEIRFTQKVIDLRRRLLQTCRVDTGDDWEDVCLDYEVLAALLEESSQHHEARRAMDRCLKIRRHRGMPPNGRRGRRSRAS